MPGAVDQVYSGSTLIPWAHVTSPSDSATVKTSTRSAGKCLAQLANTSQGPAQSSSSTPSNKAMPMRKLGSWLLSTVCCGGPDRARQYWLLEPGGLPSLGG